MGKVYCYCCKNYDSIGRCKIDNLPKKDISGRKCKKFEDTGYLKYINGKYNK